MADIIRSSAAEYLTYVAAIGKSDESVEVRYEDENLWLTQKLMAQLYDVNVKTINYHLNRIYADCELPKEATIRKFQIVQMEGSRQITREVIHYDLHAIIAVGFKVNSELAAQFRRWANMMLHDYTIQGWAIDDQRLKSGNILQGAGNISTALAKQHAETEFEKYRIKQDSLYESDFDRFLRLQEASLGFNEKKEV